jgi:hypothetical protein
MRFLSPRRGRALADAISPCHRAQVLLAAYGGLRIEELAELRRGRVNLLRGTGDLADIIVEARATAKSPSDCSMPEHSPSCSGSARNDYRRSAGLHADRCNRHSWHLATRAMSGLRQSAVMANAGSLTG